MGRSGIRPRAPRGEGGAAMRCFILSCLLASGVLAQEFPDGPAKQYVTRICQQCHEPGFLMSQRRSEADWKKTVTRMSQKGGGGTTEQYDAIAAYMFRNFGKQEIGRAHV